MENFSSLLLYFSAFIISIYFVKIYQSKIVRDQKYSKAIRILIIIGIILPIIIIQGFRYGIGTDYKAYERIFYFAGTHNRVDVNYMKEPIFRFLCIIVKNLFGTSTAFFFVDAIIMNVLLFLDIDYYRERVSMSIVYFSYYMLCFSVFLNLERQGLAATIVWYSFRFIEERKFGKFLFTILFAAGVHNTAILFIVLYAVNIVGDDKIKKYIRGIIFLAILMAPVFFRQIILLFQQLFPILSQYDIYISEESQSVGVKQIVSLNILYYIAMLIIPILVFRKSIAGFLKRYNYLLICLLLQIVFYFLDLYVKWGSRLVYYVFFGLIIIIGAACQQLHYQINRRIVKLYFVMALCVYYYRMYFLFGYGEVYPYQFFWS